jgi:hypothetical protein
MSRDAQAIIELSESLRVAAYYDEWRQDGPFDWGVLFVQTLRKDSGMSELTTDDGHRAAIREIQEHNPYTSYDGYSRERLTKRNLSEQDAIRKHLTRAGFDCTFAELRGYSQGEWLDAVIYAKAGDVGDWAATVNEIDAWFRGDVYTVTLERLEVYTSTSGNELTQWETIDALGGVILTEPLTLELAKELLEIDAATVAA